MEDIEQLERLRREAGADRAQTHDLLDRPSNEIVDERQARSRVLELVNEIRDIIGEIVKRRNFDDPEDGKIESEQLLAGIKFDMQGALAPSINQCTTSRFLLERLGRINAETVRLVGAFGSDIIPPEYIGTSID